MKTYTSFWDVLIYKNISFYKEKFEFLQTMLKRTSIICKSKEKLLDKSSNCIQTIKLVEIQIPIIINKMISLSHLINHKIKSKRVKRGVFNGVGKLLHWAFGIADSDDTEYYDNIINKINNDEKGINTLMKEQIHVVKSTIANFNESVNSFKRNENILNRNIVLLNTYLNTTNKELGTINEKLVILNHLNLITYLVNEINSEYNELIDSVLFARNNVIQPSVITPTQLINELESNVKLLKDGKEFPVPLTDEFSSNLLEISQLKTYYAKDNLIFVLSIPLPSSTIYYFYHVIPLPIPYPNTSHSYAYIQPQHKYVAMAQNRMTYALLEDLNKCIDIREKEKICQINTIYSTINYLPCEISLLVLPNKQIPPTCTTRTLSGRVNIWKELKNNQWIYVLSNLVRLTVSCNKFEIHDTELTGTGIITLNETCKGYTEFNQLIPISKTTTHYQNIIPKINIVDDCCDDKKENITENQIHLESITFTNLKLEDLQVANHKLKQLDKVLDHLLEEPHIVRHQKWYLVVLSVIGSLLGTYIVYKCFLWTGLWKMFPCFKFKSSRHKDCCIQIFNQCSNNRTRRTTDISLEQVAEETDETTTFRPTSRRSISKNRDMRTYPDL